MSQYQEKFQVSKHTRTQNKKQIFLFKIQSILQSHFTHNSNQHGLADVYQGSNNMAKFQWSLDHTAENLLEGAAKAIEICELESCHRPIKPYLSLSSSLRPSLSHQLLRNFRYLNLIPKIYKYRLVCLFVGGLIRVCDLSYKILEMKV